MKVLHVVGARPNFMKAAPVHRALAVRDADQLLVHTGQHYDLNMSRVFFDELELPEPDVNLEVGSGSHAFQTAEVMKRIEPVLTQERPDLVLVYGDVNSTVASAMAACKLQIPVGHVEAGLRSFDRTMPEEINRIITDQISDLLFIHSPDAEGNLVREGIDPARIHFVGNVMIDTLVRLLPKASERGILDELSLTGGQAKVIPYVLVTLHRPSNVDEPVRLRHILRALKDISEKCAVVFPAHPRTRYRIGASGIEPSSLGLRFVEPVGYLDFLCLEAKAGAVVTDSGGIQEETTYLGVPCFTVRRNTERPVTVRLGTNKLIGDGVRALAELVLDSIGRPHAELDPPEYWDGMAAERIADVLFAWYD